MALFDHYQLMKSAKVVMYKVVVSVVAANGAEQSYLIKSSNKLPDRLWFLILRTQQMLQLILVPQPLMLLFNSFC